jgi:hypothetical protein
MHPIDRLGEIRAQIRALRKEAKEITTKLDAGACSDTGHKFHAKTHLRVAVHPMPPAQPPADPYSYQNPMGYQHLGQNQFQQAHSQFGLSGAMPADTRAYGVGEPAIGVGKRE